VDAVPAIRLRGVNTAPIRADRDVVLYWMIAARRTRFNFALERAVEHARRLDKPLVVLEALRSDYRWRSDRLHRFVLDGMADNAARLRSRPVTYHPYVEPAPGAGRGLFEAWARRAAVVVTDEFPCFFLPRMVAAAGRRLDVRFEAVDGNGLLPLRAAERAYPTAHAFRRHLQKTLPAHLNALPVEDALARVRLSRIDAWPAEILERWPPAAGADLSRLPIDHDVPPVPYRGGARAGEHALAAFLDERLVRYAEERNQPEREAGSGLSPYLHFGHVSMHEVLEQLAAREAWSLEQVSPSCGGSREGWWGMSVAAEAFLDQAVTWRELGYNFCASRDDHDRYESLPDWARATLAEHAGDRREYVYDLETFERGATHDPLWNAAEMQLVREGRIHNYLRMLWGKKILEWTRDPVEALEVMIELNNKYAIDGRDPNSYAGIFWILGRYDRPWGPERPVFGKIRCMTSSNTARKFPVDGYISRYAPAPSPGPGLLWRR
jgi:deoxyribodipyrimidine photo-lyase